jgi:hypothetical protein
MNPIVSIILKQLPNLLPVIESLLKKRPPAPHDDNRLAAVQQSLELLAERSDYLEARLKRLTLYVVIALLMALTALLVILLR